MSVRRNPARPAELVKTLREAGVPDSHIERAFAGKHVKGPWKRRHIEQPASPEKEDAA